MAETLNIPEAMRGDIKLIRHIGDVWMRTNILHKNTSGDATTKEVDIYMGCLKENWKLNSSLGTEEIPFSCSTGSFTLAKDKAYAVSLATRNLPPMLMAAIMGMKTTEYFAGTTERVLLEEKRTLPLVVVTGEDSEKYIDISDTITDLDDIVKMISLRRKRDKSWWSLADTASESDRTVTITEADSVRKITFEDAEVSSLVADEQFTLTIQYERVMETGEFLLSEDGHTFPNTADFVLSWFVKVESGPSKGRKGCLIARVNNCMRTGDFEIGGETQDISSSNIEYNVNFEEEGDVEFHFTWLD